ncbi:MAG: undecaprenyl-phosphate glucose phosphotransferase [Planctomycetes bacterium]|nr:undecaprenyl-phosphate glucose phosphotransferase [Planctomycetota bacterium]
MLREHAFFWRTCFIASDLGVSAAAFLLAYALRFHPALAGWLADPREVPPFEAYLHTLPAVCGILLVTNSYFRLYQARRISKFSDELVDLLKSDAMAILLLMTFFFLNREFSYSRSIIAIFAVLNPLVVFLFRFALRTGLRLLRSRGYNLRSVLIVGTGRSAQALLHRLRRNTWTGMRVVGFVSASRERSGTTIHGVPVVGAAEDISRVLEEHPANQVFIALPLGDRARLVESVLQQLADSLVAVRIVPDLGYLLEQNVTTDFDGLPIVNLWENHLTGANVLTKRALDLGIATVALVVLGPLMAAIAAAIRLTSGRPIFYLQARMGHDGRVFPMLKFRTMRSGSEDDTRFTQPDDDRCTRLGRFLRRTSLDELPQLLNVLAGQMSLVGPRPERPVFIESFRKTLPRYMLRHKVKAGMTGWAQVNGWRGATSPKKRLQYDLYYLHNWSLGFDLKILLMTLLRGWTQKNAY